MPRAGAGLLTLSLHTLVSLLGATVVHADAPIGCDHISVGAGPAGVYYAWRLALAPSTPPNSTICIFERLDRVGGRVASMINAGLYGDLTVEPGAYRFAPQKFCGTLGHKPACLWTPIVGGIIDDALGLKSARYNPNASEFDHHLYKIVDSKGKDAGFAQYIWGMLDEAIAVANEGKIQIRIFLEHTLESINVPSSDRLSASASQEPVVLNLRNANGAPIVALASQSVLLNLPQLPLMRVMVSSGAMARPPAQLHQPNPAAYMKLYLHYNDAWWRGGRYASLNLSSGHFSNLNISSGTLYPGVDTMHDFPGLQSPAPLSGAYHDGDVRCIEDSTGMQRCRGYIQAHYSDDFFALMFYRSFGALGPGEAITNVSRHSHGQAGQWLLDEVHAALVELHAASLGPVVTKQILQDKATQPDHAILSMWDAGAQGFGAACHFSRINKQGTVADEALDVARHSLRPFLLSAGERRVFVASEAFAPLQCWSEGALQMAENALQRLGLERPSWMPTSVYESVLFTDASERDDSSTQQLQGFAAKNDMPAHLALVGGKLLAASIMQDTHQTLNV